jgi:hypothetical protein
LGTTAERPEEDMASAEEIIEACSEARGVAASVKNCNEFVIAVAAKCGSGSVEMPTIMSEAGPPWEQLGHDGIAASTAAAKGALVVGGMTSQALGGAHGHIVIVVKAPLARGKYPTAYWGSQNPRIRAGGGVGTTIDYSFAASDRDRVTYACFGNPPAPL